MSKKHAIVLNIEAASDAYALSELLVKLINALHAGGVTDGDIELLSVGNAEGEVGDAIDKLTALCEAQKPEVPENVIPFAAPNRVQ